MTSEASARGRSNRRRGLAFQTLIRQYFEPLSMPRSTFEIKAHALSGMKVDDLLLAISDRDGMPVFDLSIECKLEKSVNLTAGWEQAKEQAEKRGACPVLIHKAYRQAEAGKQWVTMDLECYTGMLEELTKRDPAT